MPDVGQELEKYRRVKETVMNHFQWSEERFLIWWRAKNFNFNFSSPRELFMKGRISDVEKFVNKTFSSPYKNPLNVIDDEDCFHVLENNQIKSVLLEGWEIDDEGSISNPQTKEFFSRYAWFATFEDALICYHKNICNYTNFKRAYEDGVFNIRRRESCSLKQ